MYKNCLNLPFCNGVSRGQVDVVSEIGLKDVYTIEEAKHLQRKRMTWRERKVKEEVKERGKNQGKIKGEGGQKLKYG